MKTLNAVILAALLLLGVFAALNWGVLTMPTRLSMLAFSIDAPLGVVLLGAALFFAAIALVYAAMQRTSMLLETRRHNEALQAQRDIAERAEASRLRELQAQLEREFAALRKSIEEGNNGLAACIAQVDDRLRDDKLRAGSARKPE